MQPPSRARPTEQAAACFLALAGALRARGHEAHAVARALVELLVCLFAEAAQRLPAGQMRALLAGVPPAQVLMRARELVRALMGADDGGVGDAAPPLVAEDVARLREVALLDWLAVEPSLLGTLFEGGLHPSRRRQLGAHYSDRDAISRVLGPVMLAPLQREFHTMQAAALATDEPGPLLRGFLGRLRALRVLDPSCGAGNFLYVALQALLDLERDVLEWAAMTLGIHEQAGVGVQAVLGIELNPQASALARLTIWIAQLQWSHAHGPGHAGAPGSVGGIECRDALLELCRVRRRGAPAGPTRSSSSATRRFSAARSCAPGSAITTSMRCFAHGTATSRARRTSGLTSTRWRAR